MKESMPSQDALVQEKNGRGGAPKELALDAVIKSINGSLSIAQSKLKGVTLNEGSVTLETTYSNEGGGGFKLFVRAERKWSKESTNTVTYNYKKPEKKGVGIDTQDQLADIIYNVAKQYEESEAMGGLDKDGFEIELSLSITNKIGGGLEFEVFGVGFEAGADFEKTVFHKITLSFS